MELHQYNSKSVTHERTCEQENDNTGIKLKK